MAIPNQKNIELPNLRVGETVWLRIPVLGQKTTREKQWHKGTVIFCGEKHFAVRGKNYVHSVLWHDAKIGAVRISMEPPRM